MIKIIIGAVLATIGIILIFVKKQKMRKLNVLNDTENSKATEIIQNHQFFKEQYGDGAYSHYVIITGLFL